MAKNNPTKAQLEAENKFLRRGRVSEGIVSVFNNLIRWGAISFIAYCAYLSISALAGKTTISDIGIAFLTEFNLDNLANTKIDKYSSYAVALSAVIYGNRQKILRKTTVERLHKRVQELESRQDPDRTSSELTTKGETRPEDII